MEKDRFWKELSGVLLRREEVRPTGPGWYRYTEVQKRLGLSRNATSKWINAALRRGDVESFSGTIHNGKQLVKAKWLRKKQ